MSNTVFNRFKKTDCAAVKALTEAQAAGKGQKSGEKRHSLFADTVTNIHKWTEGTSFIRFLPQPEGSPFGWCAPVDVIEIFDDKAAMQGAFLIGAEVEDGGQHHSSFKPQLDKIRKLLYSHPEYKLAMFSRANPNGIRLTTKCRILFQGFDVTASPFKVEFFRLPANYPNAGNAPVQCGTRIKSFTTDIDRNGGFKYGDITDLETGHVVKIDVQNPGKQSVSYYPEVEERLSLIDEAFIPALEAVKSFDDVLHWPTQEQFQKLIRQLIPAEEVSLYNYVAGQMGWDKPIPAAVAEVDDEKPF